MSEVQKTISLSIQRSIKIAEYQYNKVELGMMINIEHEQSINIIGKLYRYIDTQVYRLLKVELAKATRDKQAVADMIIEGQNDILY